MTPAGASSIQSRAALLERPPVAVEPDIRAVIELAAEGAVLRFTWLLCDDQCGTSLTQRVEFEGEAAARYLDAM